MGYWPAWLYTDVHELTVDHGRLTSTVGRSAALAATRDRLGTAALRPAAGEDTREWIGRTFSLAFDYSWPTSTSDRPL